MKYSVKIDKIGNLSLFKKNKHQLPNHYNYCLLAKKLCHPPKNLPENIDDFLDLPSDLSWNDGDPIQTIINRLKHFHFYDEREIIHLTNIDMLQKRLNAKNKGIFSEYGNGPTFAVGADDSHSDFYIFLAGAGFTKKTTITHRGIYQRPIYRAVAEFNRMHRPEMYWAFFAGFLWSKNQKFITHDTQKDLDEIKSKIHRACNAYETDNTQDILDLSLSVIVKYSDNPDILKYYYAKNIFENNF